MGCDISFMNELAKRNRQLKDENGNKIIDKKILLLGLENAGKTSFLLHCKDG